MAELRSGRVDPRALLRSLNSEETGNLTRTGALALGRASVVAIAAAAGLAAFGTLVVRANDDAGALAFIRAQTKPRAAAVDYAPARPAYPVSYYAPRAFFPSAQPVRRTEAAVQAGKPQPRSGAIVASYAPFVGFLPSDSFSDGAARRSAVRIKTPSVAKATVSAPRVGGIGRGGSVTYCVRTCDGFFFPLGPTSGNDRADEAACNRMCPTAETKLYVGQVGADIDDARARQTGRRYAAMSNAFSYRTSLDKSCGCNAGGPGLTATSVYGDRTLKVGDIIVTPKGMRVFTGGQLPYRDANFTTLDRSGRFAGQTRESLRSMEQASLPGKSGVQRQAQRRSDELKDLQRAVNALPSSDQLVRYVGPDRTAIAR
jgi:Protein of unknown function (DUF2865)